MGLDRRYYKIYIFFLLTFLLTITKPGNAVNNAGELYIIYPQQDTVASDTLVGPLPFPFKDQPAFGKSNGDTLKLFLNT